MRSNRKTIFSLTILLFFVFVQPNFISPLIKSSNKILIQNTTWTRTWNKFGLEYGSDLAVDSSNNIYLGGITETSENIDNETHHITIYHEYMAIVKYDTLGNQLWEKIWRYKNIYDTYGTFIENDSLDNIYACGSTSDLIILLKLNQQGNEIWNRTWKGEGKVSCSSIAIDGSDNVYLAGRTYNESSQKYHATLLKYDLSGNLLWNINLSNGYEILDLVNPSIVMDSNNSIFLHFYNNLLKLNSSGIILIDKILFQDLNFVSERSQLILDKEDNLLISLPGLLIKVNNLGDQLWNQSISSNFNWPLPDPIAIDNFNNIFMAGHKRIDCVDNSFFMSSLCICTAIYLQKFDCNGTLLWEKRCTGCSDSRANSIILDSLNNIYIGGTIVSDLGCTSMRWDFLLIKNPVEFLGRCAPIYYDLIALITIPLALLGVGLIIFIKIKKKKKKFRI